MNEVVKAKVQSIIRTPELIAAEINSIKEKTRRVLLYNSIEIGRRLVEAKEVISHGEWSEWLKKSVDYSQRTANNLMKIFEEYGADQISLLGDNIKSQAFANLSYTQAVALLGVPEEERENFVKENNIDNMSTRELQKAIKEKQKLEKKLKDTEEENDKSRKQAEKLRKELENVKSKNKEALTNKEVEIENLKMFIEDTKKQLQEAKDSGNGEEIEKVQSLLQSKETELIDSREKIKELEKLLEDKPVEVTETTVEKIPEEFEKELNELREKVKQQPKSNESLVKFKIHFEKTVGSFKDLLKVLGEIKESNKGEYEKYKNATAGLLNKMLDNL